MINFLKNIIDKYRFPVLQALSFLQSFIPRNYILVYVTKSRLILKIAYNRQPITTRIISLLDSEFLTEYCNFLKAFAGYNIYFLQDTEVSSLTHEIIPALNTQSQTKLINEFIAQHYSDQKLVAYNIYNVDQQDFRKIELLVASTDYKPPLSKMVKTALTNKLKFGGIYFLSLELAPIINLALKQRIYLRYWEDVQIFVTIFQAAVIRTVVKHHNNIISIHSIDSYDNNSNAYLQGLIEEQIFDITTNLKTYIKLHNVSIVLIFSVPEELNILLASTKFENAEKIFLSSPERPFSENRLIDLFVKRKKYPALNKNIHCINQWYSYQKITLKLLISFTIIGLINCFSQYQKLSLSKKIIQDSTFQYNIITDNIQKIEKNHADINNFDRLADLYRFKNLLNISINSPFNLLDNVIANLSKDSKIVNLQWTLIDQTKAPLLQNSQIRAEITLNLTCLGGYKDQASNQATDFITHIKTKLNDYKTNYRLDSNKIINLSDKIIIPIELIIEGPLNNLNSDGAQNETAN